MSSLQFEELEEWTRLEDEQENAFLLEVDPTTSEIQPVISSIKKEKEDIIEDTRRDAATCVETLNCELRKLISSEKKLRLDYEDMARRVSVRKSCIEEARSSSEALSQEILSLKARKEVKNNELEEKKKLLKEKFAAHVEALSYYKQNLQCYLDFEDDNDLNTFTFYFFRSSRNSSTKDYSVKLSHRNGAWELLAMTPQLPSFHRLQEELRIHNDIHGFIAHVHKCFKLVKEASGRK